MLELNRQELLLTNCISDHSSIEIFVIKSCLYLSLIETEY